MTNLIEGGVDQDYLFSYNDGLFIAAALTMSGSDSEILDDPRYGSIIF